MFSAEQGKDIGLGLGIPAALVAGAAYTNNLHRMGSNFVTGAMISFGADPLEAGSTFKGSVFAFGDDGAHILKNTVRGYSGTATFGGAAGGEFLKFGRIGQQLYTVGGAGNLMKGGLSKMNPLNMLAPGLFTGIGTVNAMMDGGITGGVEYLVQDAMGMAAANANLNQVFEVDLTNQKQLQNAANKFGISKNEILQEAGKNKTMLYNTQRTLMGSAMAGQFLTMGGGIIGAGAGMEVGKFIGKSIGTSLGVENTGALGLAGAIFGGMGGAHLGGMMFASLPRAVISGLGIAATTMVAKGAYSMLESGFRKEKMRHSRGLNFASDTSQFMTQQAVTMRQRAMQAMHKSHLNARSAFGQEATITHMNRDMFSHYKR
jgi:hypothetical protein